MSLFSNLFGDRSTPTQELGNALTSATHAVKDGAKCLMSAARTLFYAANSLVNGFQTSDTTEVVVNGINTVASLARIVVDAVSTIAHIGNAITIGLTGEDFGVSAAEAAMSREIESFQVQTHGETGVFLDAIADNLL